jgi:hypothetical protein
VALGAALALVGAIAFASAEDRGAGPSDVWVPGEPLGGGERNVPDDPNSDIAWSGGMSGIADIQAAFNNARTQENSQLGLSIPPMTLPSQGEWDGMSDSDKAFWLSNRERIDRGVHPMHGVEANVESVAEYYANYLLDNDAWGHTADGNTPPGRLNDNPAIGACHDFLPVSENLAAFMSSGPAIPLPVERSVYGWMYVDASSGWGHRHAILYYPYTDNSGPAGKEGFMGIGRASGGPWQGWPVAEVVVMNVFDPCATWVYDDEIFSDGFETGDTSAWAPPR